MRVRWGIALLLASCTQPHYTNGGLACASSGRACPDSFHCAVDQRCWRNGSDPDLGAGPFDLGLADLAQPRVDLIGVDLIGADLAHRDLAMMLGDLAQPAGDLAGNPSLCAGLSVKLCDGFEGSLNTTRWTKEVKDDDMNVVGTITVDNTRPYRGATSLHLKTAMAGAANKDPEANVETYDGLPIATTIYLRAWVYFAPGTPTDFDQMLNFSDAAGTGLAYTVQDNFATLNNYTDHTTFESAIAGIPTGAWTCLRFIVPQDGSGNIQLFVGNTEATDLTVSAAGTPAFDHVYLGFDWVTNSANMPAAEMWIDEVILDDHPLTCEE